MAGGSWQEGVAGGTISNVYYNKELSPKAGAKTGTALTTNQMFAKSSFTGFDFDSIWGRNDTINGGYPYLRCFYDSIIPDSPDPIKVTGIDFTEAGQILNAIAGEPIQLHASVLPAEAKVQDIAWSIVSGMDYANVDENGVVNVPYLQNRAGGTQKIVVAATTYEGNFQKTCTLNVYYPSLILHRSPISHRMIGETTWIDGGSNFYGRVNREYLMKIYVTPDSLHQPISITNSNPNAADFAIVSQDTMIANTRCALGVLTCYTEGETTITVTHPKGYSYSLTRTIQVANITSLAIKAPSTSLTVGDTMQLTAIPYPEDASYPLGDVVWSSSNESILKVDASGVVMGVGEGTATVTLTSTNPSLSATKEITVEHVQPSSLEIVSSDEDGTITEGDTCILSVNFYPENTTMRDVEWYLPTQRDSEYVQLISMGDSCKVVGLKEGRSIRIRAKSLGTSGCYANYYVTITPKVLITDMSFQDTSVSMENANTKTLVLTITPGATESVIFKSSNEDVVTIDGVSEYASMGLINITITANGVGNTTITATVEESGLTATCEVTVLSNNFFTINFVNEDGTILQSSQIREFEMPAYTGATPTKTETAEFSYLFEAWTPALVPATEDATYTATYTAKTRYYVITFRNWDGSELQSSLVAYGTLPKYTGETPTRPSTAQYNYVFEGWSPEVVSVTTNASYTARFTSLIRQYTVTFIDWNGTYLSKQLVDYGTAATAPADPIREGYTFIGWDKDFSNVQSDLTVKAQYEKNIVYYTVTFLDWDGTELYVEQVEEGKDAIGPAENPTREGYIFIGWSKPITNVTSDLIVIALYDKVSAVDDVEAGNTTIRKVIEDQQLRIMLPNGDTYNAMGQKM